MDDSTFHDLLLTEVESIHRLAYHLCRDSHEAEDLVQETYLHALRAAHTFESHAYGVRPWLFKILHNVLHTRRARDRRSREMLKRLGERRSVDESGPGASYLMGDGQYGGRAESVSVNWENTDERLLRAIRLLPVAHRSVFLLAAVEDLKYREIADIVGAPVGTVMSRLSRARAALAGQLGLLAAEHNLREGPQSAGQQGTSTGQNES